MKKTHVCCTPCSKYRKFKNTKISYIFEKTYVITAGSKNYTSIIKERSNNMIK